MGPRYSVFLRRRADLTIERLHAGLAESLRGLAARTNTDGPAAVAGELEVEAAGSGVVVRHGDARVYVVRCPTEQLAPILATTIAELSPELATVAALRDHLAATVDVVVASCGPGSTSSTAVLLAGNVAHSLARDHEGIIYGALADWYRLGDRHQLVDIKP